MKKEELLKFYQQYKLFVFPIGVAISALILIVFVIFPQTMKLLDNQRLGADLEFRSKLLVSKVAALESYDQADLSRKVSLAVGAYPSSQDFVSVMGLLQSLAGQSGFSTVSMFLGTSVSRQSDTQSYSLKLDVLGPISNLSALLSDIENSPRLMRIGSVGTSTVRDSQGATASINVEVLYSVAPADAGSVDSPLPELSAEDEEVLAQLAKADTLNVEPQTPAQLGPRGKANPFE